MKKAFLTLCAAVYCFTAPVTTLAVDWGEIGTGLFATAGVIAGLGGACMAADWFSGSDESVISNAKSALDSITYRYQDHCQRLDTYLRGCVGKDIENDFCYPVARYAWNNEELQVSYQNVIANDIALLKKQIHTLTSRMRKREKQDAKHMRRNSDALYADICYEMSIVVKEIEAYLPRLQELFNLVNRHSTYFDLCNAEWRINAQYKQLLDLIDSDRYGLLSVQELLYIIRADISTTSYKIIAFVKEFDNDMQALKNRMERLSYGYPVRYEWSSDLFNKMSRIRARIDQEYQNELRDREDSYIRERELATAQQRVWVEQEKVDEMRRENNLKEFELRQKNNNRYE